MNCTACHRVLYPKQLKCACGWKRPNDSLPDEIRPRSVPCAAVERVLVEHEAKVYAWVEKYRAAHPGASAREACLEGLRKKGIINMLPKSLKK